MRLKSDFMIPAMVLVIVGVIIGFLILGGDTLLGLDSDDTNTIISLLPGVIVLFVAFYAVSISRGYMQSGAIAGVGLAFVFLIHLMDEASILIPSVGMSASDLSIVIIIIFLILATGTAVSRYR